VKKAVVVYRKDASQHFLCVPEKHHEKISRQLDFLPRINPTTTQKRNNTTSQSLPDVQSFVRGDGKVRIDGEYFFYSANFIGNGSFSHTH
jgi:hypothetical protein